ncbi:YadA C-terminal domain-containing protein [Caballeronia sp. NK8]|nr:YadA C-terminal domain-containing protein [Caballeronia sp. NK8]
MIGGLQRKISHVGRTAYSGIAAAAMAMIPNIDQDKTMSIDMGGASYQGYAAAAVALNLRVTKNLVMKAGVGTSRNGTVYGANASYRW